MPDQRDASAEVSAAGQEALDEEDVYGMQTPPAQTAPGCQPQEWELHTPNFCIKLFYAIYSRAITSVQSSNSRSGGSLK